MSANSKHTNNQKNLTQRNHFMLMVFLLGPFLFFVLNGCTLKNRPKNQHEEKKEWTPSQTPENLSVEEKEFLSLNLSQISLKLKNANDKNQNEVFKEVVQSLSRFVLNQIYIENPQYQTTRLREMISLFNYAFLRLLMLNEKDIKKDLALFKKSFYHTVFSGCSFDLKIDCVNKDVFSADSNTSRILLTMANEFDERIQGKLISYPPHLCIEQLEECRQWVAERYRLLAMAHAMKKNKSRDDEFAFSYLKYARLYAFLIDWWKKGQQDLVISDENKIPAFVSHSDMSLSYLNEVHGKIFEILITHFQPNNINDTDLKNFVENFNPWTYSNRQGKAFSYGTQIMFDLGARCCLYSDNTKTTLSSSMREAIDESQKDRDERGASFTQMVQEIVQSPATKDIFKYLGVERESKMVLHKHPDLFNELFFVVDRLFREHLDTSQVLKVLSYISEERVKEKLPFIVQTYVKLNIIYLINETNKFMSQIYLSQSLSSDEIFREALIKSRDLSSRWQTLQSRMDQLDKVLESYTRSRSSSLLTQNFNDTISILRSVNRNVHYFSVYPHMMVMTYYLAKMKGKVEAQTWWGQKFEIPADIIMDQLIEGRMKDVWFHFGTTPEILSREMLLFAFQYAMKTHTFNTFITKEGEVRESENSDRGKFFDLLFSKYLGEQVNHLQEQVQDFERSFFQSHYYETLEKVCAYEMNDKDKIKINPPPMMIHFLSLDSYTYSGVGANGLNDFISHFFTDSFSAVRSINSEISRRATYVKVLVDLIETDLLYSDQIKKRGDSHPDLEKARELLKNLESLKGNLVKLFVRKHQYYFDCILTLKEIERRRMHRLYEEERQHLGTIHDLLSRVVEAGDHGAILANQINQEHFKNSKNGYRFDYLNGATYMMSKYDLFMRLKRNIETDIFKEPTEQEKKNYNDKDLEQLTRPRRVNVEIPHGIEREDMVAKSAETKSTVSLSYVKDKQEFIRQGMNVFNGKGEAFINWGQQIANEGELKNYINTLVEYYLMGSIDVQKENCTPANNISCQEKVGISADTLIDHYVRVLESFSLDEWDVRSANELGTDGKKNRNFFEGWLFEKGSYNRLPLFYYLMDKVLSQAKLRLQTAESNSSAGPISSLSDNESMPLEEARLFAATLNNLDTFIFPPGDEIKKSVKDHYGYRAHLSLQRVEELYQKMNHLNQNISSFMSSHSQLLRPFYMENKNQKIFWADSQKLISVELVDDQKIKDLNAIKNLFLKSTGNFYETKFFLRTNDFLNKKI